VFQEIEYAAAVSSAPRFDPSSRNCTPATPPPSVAVADTVTAVPRTIAPAAGADRVTVGGVVSPPEPTVSVKLVVRLTPPPAPVTVIVRGPVGVEVVVVSVSVVMQPGEQEAGEKDAVIPAPRPLAEKVTGVVVPAARVALTELVTEFGTATVRAPPFVSAKSKAGAGVVADAGADWADTLPAASWAATAYVYVVDGVRPPSVNDVPAAVPTWVPFR